MTQNTSLRVNLMCIQHLIQKQFKDKISLTLLIPHKGKSPVTAAV